MLIGIDIYTGIILLLAFVIVISKLPQDSNLNLKFLNH